MQSRMIAKAWSDESQSCDASEDSFSDETSDNNNTSTRNVRSIRYKKKLKRFSPDIFSSKTKPVKTCTEHYKPSIHSEIPNPPSRPLADRSARQTTTQNASQTASRKLVNKSYPSKVNTSLQNHRGGTILLQLRN